MFGNYFGGTLSVGVGPYSRQDLNNGDNGVYIIGDDWEIIEREYHDKPEQLNHDYYEMVESIKEINDSIFIKTKGEK
jgi:hypothetical protein